MAIFQLELLLIPLHVANFLPMQFVSMQLIVIKFYKESVSRNNDPFLYLSPLFLDRVNWNRTIATFTNWKTTITIHRIGTMPL